MTDNVPEETKKKGHEIVFGKTGKDCPLRFVFKGDNLEKVIVREDLQCGAEGLEKVFGTSELDLVNEIINRSTDAMGNSTREQKQNMLAQSLADYKPRNAIEAKLCAQAQVLFSQAMRLVYYANEENMINQQEHCLKNAVKFFRLHNETLQTLDRLRRKEQRIVVQHVTVESGGNAAVLTKIEAGGGEKEKSEG